MPKKLSQEEFERRLEEKFNGLYECCEKFNGVEKEIKFFCNKHKEYFIAKPKNLLSGSHSCPFCHEENMRKIYNGKTMTTEIYIQRAKEVHGDRFIYDKTAYNGKNKDVLIGCRIHGYFWQDPFYHLRGGGCKKCSFPVHSTESFIAESIKTHGNKYIYTKSNYVNSNTKICIICPIHGEFWQYPKEHVRGYGCAKCKQSKTELVVENSLKERSINYINVCHDFGLGYQSVDFYLNDFNVAIECQGAQHFSNNKFFFDKENEFKKALERDIRKYNICKEQEIELIYYIPKYIFNESIFTDEKFGRIYQKDNVFTDIDNMLEYITKKE